MEKRKTSFGLAIISLSIWATLGCDSPSPYDETTAPTPPARKTATNTAAPPKSTQVVRNANRTNGGGGGPNRVSQPGGRPILSGSRNGGPRSYASYGDMRQPVGVVSAAPLYSGGGEIIQIPEPDQTGSGGKSGGSMVNIE